MTNYNKQDNGDKQQYKQYIIGLQQPLYDLAKDETDLRLQHLIEIINMSTQSLHCIINPQSINQYKYNIKTNIYNNFLFVVSNVIKKKCEKGINFTRFKKEINKKNIWNTLKGYYFHNIPNIIVENLWIPLLKDIYMFYNNVATNWSINKNNILKLNGLQMQKYLNKKFLKELLEVKCQINQNSNPSGQLMQCACWKIESFQYFINMYFDDNNSYVFKQWINTKKNGSSTKNMSIQQIVSKYIKTNAQLQYKLFINSIGINVDYNSIQIAQTTKSQLVYNNVNTVRNINNNNNNTSNNNNRCAIYEFQQLNTNNLNTKTDNKYDKYNCFQSAAVQTPTNGNLQIQYNKQYNEYKQNNVINQSVQYNQSNINQSMSHINQSTQYFQQNQYNQQYSQQYNPIYNQSNQYNQTNQCCQICCLQCTKK